MANSKAISVRIPDELLEKIDRLAEEKYKSHKGTPNRSLVVLDAIVDYFDRLSTNVSREITVSDSVSIADFDELRKEVIELKATVRDLLDKTFAVSDSVSDIEEKLPEQNQLSIITVSDSEIKTGEDLKHLSNEVTLTADRLAARLKIEISTLRAMKSKFKDDAEGFLHWSKSKDPDGYGWMFEKKYGSPFHRVGKLPNLTHPNV